MNLISKNFFFQVLYTAIVLYGPSLTLESGKKVFDMPTENIYMCRIKSGLFQINIVIH